MSTPIENIAVRLTEFSDAHVLEIDTLDIPAPTDDEIMLSVGARWR